MEISNHHLVANIKLAVESLLEQGQECYQQLHTLVSEKWAETNNVTRDMLLQMLGQVARAAVDPAHMKDVAQLLWDTAHIPEIPKHLMERAFAEHLATINEMTLNKDAVIITTLLLQFG